MPGIFRMSCAACSFSVEAQTSQTYVIKDDGAAEVCGHPGEVRRAESVTGVPWRELVRAGRIQVRFALLCLGCGVLDHYGPDDGPAAPAGSHTWQIVHHPTPEQLAGVRCRSCGAARLHPITPEPGILRPLARWLSGKAAPRPRCPRCHAGELASRMVGIS